MERGMIFFSAKMNRFFVLMFLFFLGGQDFCFTEQVQVNVFEKRMSELDWSKSIAKRLNGIVEYRLPDGSRVDILTDNYAIEVEWVSKWKESIGQSVFYGICTNRKPKIILLLKGEDRKEIVYYLRCAAVCAKLGIEFDVVDVRYQKNRERD